MVAEKQSLSTAITICCTLEPDQCRYWKELLQFFIDRKNKQVTLGVSFQRMCITIDACCVLLCSVLSLQASVYEQARY